MDFIEELGMQALGTRIKNLSELLMRDVSRIYKDQNVDFEPRWFTMFQLILRKTKISVTEIARELKQTHPAVVQVVNSLEKKKLITTRKSKTDQRKRLVSLTKKGKKLAEDLSLVWEAIHQAAKEILAESEPDLLGNIAKVEKALKQKSTYQRIKEKLMNSATEEIELIAFDEKHLNDFRQLNEDWLKSYLEITDHDRHILSDPVKEIINKNGKIYLLISEGKVIGTYALQRISDQACELSKFTVMKEFRGRKLGERMLGHAIEETRKLGCNSIVLYTHHKLKEATQFYNKMGFKVIQEYPHLIDKTGRCSQMLQLIINQ
ncbi:MAG: bifunctional helix-turn-helix transcriptional regulator/GNAT family N-acetyltransferase [Bacteroidetes bacterium]|nr:bifunctional helix-turn-helix transcriptional regulator/GNAT family N-acetyltransferase [Bacteroidota bacterium]